MNDDELRKRFGELKRSDARKAPAFDKLVAKRPKSNAPLFIALSPFVAAAAMFLLWCGARGEKTASIAPMSAVRPAPQIHLQTAAQLPLDFLLDSAPIRVNLDADPIRGFNP